MSRDKMLAENVAQRDALDRYATEQNRLKAEIEKLMRWVKLAADAYESGSMDECCVACMTISDEQKA